VNFENINLDGAYHPLNAYGQSKTANLWTANHIERKYGAHRLHAFSVHPGLVITDLMRHIPRDQVKMQANKDLISWLKTPEQGAATNSVGCCVRITGELWREVPRRLSNCEAIS
jgi:NAD(P)-dependent dehydrogenase (short-subunit alcohol dehydrogenase family)